MAARPGVALIVISKAPVPGRSKTRLCPPCEPTEAARLAEAALCDTLAAVAQTPARAGCSCLMANPAHGYRRASSSTNSAATRSASGSAARSVWRADRRSSSAWTRRSSRRGC